MVPQEDGVRLMAAAWRTHPSDYVLAYRSSHRLWGTGEGRIGEMLAWAKVAVALRPDSPFAHNQLGIAYRAMHDWDQAEASIHRAIELGRKYPKYAGARVNLGNMLLEKGELDGAEANYRAAIAIDPDTAGTYFNMGLVYDRRGDLAGAEEWYRKSLVVNPKQEYYRQILDGVVQRRVRLEELAAGRADPATTDEAFTVIGLALRSSPRQYLTAVRLYTWVFAADPALTEDLSNYHRYNAACVASMAAEGKKNESPKIETAERSRLTEMAMKWLRADLAQMTTQAKDPDRRQQIGEWLTYWKKDPDLAAVRDSAALEAMSPADREMWQALWREVDSLLASVSQH